MKRFLAIIVILLLSLVLIACNKKDTNVDDIYNPNPVPTEPNPYKDSLKVLAIGNSFSDDSIDELWKIATSWGIPSVKVGMVYRGGTSLEDHYNNIIKGESGNAYTYFKYEGVNRTSIPDTTIKYGIEDEQWDVILIQQVSGLSGLYETYNSPEPFLQVMIDHINEHKTNQEVKIAWNMTWAYSKTSNHHDYYRYEKDQMKMYEAITSSAIKVFKDYDDIKMVIPNGTAIQNARPFIGDENMTSDGYHLNHSTGRYVAAMMVFKQITGLDLKDIKHRPQNMTIATRELVKEAVEAAYIDPFNFNEIK